MKRWQFLLISCLILTAILLIHVTLEARQNEIRELEQERERQMERVAGIRQQLDEAADRLEALEDMLLNLHQMQQIAERSAAPSRGGRVTVATMPLSTPSGFTAARFERVFAGTGLAGLGQAFYGAEKKHGVNGVILAAICIHESGWGRSKLARDKGNLAGLGAFRPGLGMTFESRADCIDYLARLLAGKPGTLTEVGAWYAEDPGWARKVAACMRVIVEAAVQDGEALITVAEETSHDQQKLQ